eukprot:scaffold346256_cov35-Attheya_sp.AAC.1
MYLGNAAQDDRHIPVVLGEFHESDSQKFVIELNGTVKVSLLVEALSGIKCRGGIVETVVAQTGLADPEG